MTLLLKESGLLDNDKFVALTTLVKSKRCVVFIGSGLSKDVCGCDWESLVDKLYCASCGQHIPDCPTSGEDRAEHLMQFADDARRADEYAYCTVLEEIFCGAITRPRKAYSLLTRVQFVSYVTVNYDYQLADECSRARLGRYVTIPSFPYDCVRDRKAFYIHGIIERDKRPAANDIILTKRDFDYYYNDSNSTLLSFLHQLFCYRSILFLSCTLCEPELRRLLLACRNARACVARRHCNLTMPERYILLPSIEKRNTQQLPARCEQVAEDIDVDMYRDLDIAVIRYPPDNGHAIIEDILDYWQEDPVEELGVDPGYPSL